MTRAMGDTGQRCCSTPAASPTCPHAIFEGVPAVHQDLLQRLGLVGELQVKALHALQELVRVVEIQDFGGSVKGLTDVAGEDFHNLQQELQGGLLSVFGRQEICRKTAAFIPNV